MRPDLYGDGHGYIVHFVRGGAMQYARRKEQGLCANCGARPARPGQARCDNCATLGASASRRQRERRKEQGLCGRCGRNRTPDGRNCARCRYENARASRMRRQRDARPQCK